ncbi:MAG: hypothetical protein ABIB55_02875 [Candidatus Nealsonbacteria bacterium]
MKLYELTYLPLPGISQDEQKTLSEKVVSALETSPLGQHQNGFLITVEFNSEPEKIKEIEEKLKNEAQIQRYIILKKKLVKFKARILRRAEFSKRTEKETEKPKVEIADIEKKLNEILK